MRTILVELNEAIENCFKHNNHTMVELNGIYQLQKKFKKEKTAYITLIMCGTFFLLLPSFLFFIGSNVSGKAVFLILIISFILSSSGFKLLDSQKIDANLFDLWDIVPEKELIEVKNEINQYPEISTKLNPIINKWLLNGPITYKELNLLQNCLGIYSKMTNLKDISPAEINKNEDIFSKQKKIFSQGE